VSRFSRGQFRSKVVARGWQILDTIAEIKERHDAVRDIEKKLLELHQIFLDMAVLVEAQGELLDNIETQVCSPRKRMCFSQKQFFATSECRCYTLLCNMYVQGIPVN
jgi:hypothetical protein